MNEPLAILIAEESEEYREKIAQSLGVLTGPKTIDRADSVSAALAMLRSRPYDLVISGLHFGDERQGQSGFTVLRAVDRAHPQTRAILVTAWDNEENRLIGERYGARAIVSKVNLENRLGAIVAGVLRPTGEERPNYGTVGQGVLDLVAEMPIDTQVAFVVDLLEKFQLPLQGGRSSEKQAPDGELSLPLVARRAEDAQQLIAVTERFAEACHWINANLSPEVSGHIRARKEILAAVRARFGDRLGLPHLQECIGAVVKARQDLGDRSPDAISELAFAPQAIYPKAAMGIDTAQQTIGLRAGTDSDRKLWLDLASSKSAAGLERFGAAHLGELTHNGELEFGLKLKFL